jgi:hypothetical protein
LNAIHVLGARLDPATQWHFEIQWMCHQAIGFSRSFLDGFNLQIE